VQGDMSGMAAYFPQDFLKRGEPHESLRPAAWLTETAGEVTAVGNLNIYFFELFQLSLIRHEYNIRGLVSKRNQ
jgi:hypothetical protein